MDNFNCTLNTGQNLIVWITTITPLSFAFSRSHGIIGIKTCPIGSRSWGLACGTAKKLSSGSTFFNSIGRKHNLFKEGDSVGVLLDLHKHTLSFYR